ncbi:MAG: 4Fe-4S dicluster domain-containing protein [Proteobacteria bacterium]|nr:4Fe-4S dicluster domain-containing protein [Pseudomonadota bacterium]
MQEPEEKPASIKDAAPLRPIGLAPDLCLACGTCSSGCPMTGVDGFDPRKIVRLALLGRDRELIESKLPWICTMCGRCQYACPMGVNIVGLIRTIRGRVDRDDVPGQIHKGVELNIKTGNNLGLPTEDFEYIIESVAEELAEEPGFEDFAVRFDKQGASLLTTLHNKLVNTHNEDLIPFWKIFHVAKEDFTIPRENWEGVNWALFSGDDENKRLAVGRIVEHMERLQIARLLYPE